jgi:hypothetical protein
MRKLAIGLFAVLAGIVAISAAAIVPQQQAYAQNTVTATQSNSFSASVGQSIGQSGSSGSSIGGSGDVSQSASQGFCLQANQQNAAAGNDASNSASNSIRRSDCS